VFSHEEYEQDDPVWRAIEEVIDEAQVRTRSSHVVLRDLSGDQLVACASVGFGPSTPPDVRVTDQYAPCAKALRVAFPSLVNDVQTDEEFRRFCEGLCESGQDQSWVNKLKKLKSMLAVAVRDGIGTLGVLELFSDEKAEHFSPFNQQDWAQSFAARLAYLLRAKETRRCS